MLKLNNATRGGEEVLLLLTVPGEGQGITCGINLTSTQTAGPGEAQALVVSGTIALHTHACKT